MKKVLMIVMALLLLTAGIAAADDTSWLQISGDIRSRFDSLAGTVHDYVKFTPNTTTPPGTFTPTPGYDVKNDALLMNRFGLNLKANALEDVTVKARLVMYKVWGHETSTPFNGDFFADRFGSQPNDGTIGHVPFDNALRVDYAYATWSNIGDAPVWFSIGRRPSTGGVPSNLRQNTEKVGTAGIPAIMVDYAFDGLSLGYAPDIEALPGAYAKFCYGKGFDSGFQGNPSQPGIKDTDFYGLNVVPYDTEKLHVELQYDTGRNIFDAPSDFGVTTNLGNIDWWGGVVMSKLDNLNLFFSAAASKTDPNNNTNPMGAGLLWDSAHPKESLTGTAFYLGGRYDINSTRTKIGAEYNHGSKNWIGMVPAADDVWTSKLGTRGDVYEAYVIQELKKSPISKKGKAFFRLGYQYYKFDYTGSNNWVGAPSKISDLSTGTPSAVNAPQFFAPIKDAKDLYLTFDVQF